MRIKKTELDKIRESSTEQLIAMLSIKVSENTDKFLFVECVKYELHARKNGAQCDCDECYQDAGWEIE